MSWSLVSLDSLCHKITDGSHNPPKGISNSEYLMLSSKNVFHNEINFKNPRYLTREDFKKENKRTDVCENDVLLTIVGTIGRVAVISRDSSKFTLQRSVAVLKPKLELITPRFLMYTLRNLTSFLERSARGVAQKGIYLKQIRELKIPLPPLAEQQKIAAILDAADQLRQKDQQLIDHYTTLSQSLFLEMFGSYFKNESCYRGISEIANFIDYRGKTPKKINVGIPLISAKCVRTGYFDQSRLDFISSEVYNKVMTRGFPKVGDVLFTTEGATMGFTCRIPKGFDKFAVGQRLITLQSNELYNNISLEFVLNSRETQGIVFQQATGSAVKGIRSARFAKILIPTPPITLQNQFAQHIEKIEQQKQQAQATLKKSETLFNSLLQRAFKGELTPTQP